MDRLASLKGSVLVRSDAETPRDLTDGEAAPLAIGPEEVRERCNKPRDLGWVSAAVVCDPRNYPYSFD
jgi:hypothetical protein